MPLQSLPKAVIAPVFDWLAELSRIDSRWKCIYNLHLRDSNGFALVAQLRSVRVFEFPLLDQADLSKVFWRNGSALDF